MDVINTHGGSSQTGDLAESRAIKIFLGSRKEDLLQNTFEDLLAQQDKDLIQSQIQNTLITALKANIGHMAAGAGAAEFILSIKSLTE